MPELSLLLIFIPTWFLVSLSPGLCMSLAMTLGMTVGYKKTLWMMLGEITRSRSCWYLICHWCG